jgi:hypothetical protein
MAYTINLTDGTVFATITDGTINTSSSMTLVGKNYAGYGEFLDENFIHLLENGSNTTAPAAPLTGQLWWDKTNNLLKVYNGTIFKTISAATASASAPASNVTGDLWYDTTNQQLKVWTGVAFLVVGPGYTSAQGTSGAIPETILNNVGATRYITSLYVNNNRVAIVYDGAQFTPEASLLATFPLIYPGITLTTTNSPVFAGTAQNAALLDNLDSSDFMRATANTATTGRLQVNNANGIFIGTSNVVQISQSTNDGIIATPVSTGNLIIQTNVSGVTYTVATALGANGTFAIANAATVGTTLNVTGNVTGGNLLTGGLVSSTGNIIGGNLVTLGLANVASATVTGNVNAGNLRTVGLISATGNITTAANIAGTFILGNGSQLTGISAAVSVSKISNGTSEANIGASGGNANISIGGTSNVAVFTTSTAFFISDISVSGIQKIGSNAVGNIGSSSNYFNQVFATATTALYADVAERFAADEILEPGTVVELGGIKEITRSTQDLSENVFGVISTRPAYTMNGGAGENDTHPPVAMTGRVPVKCVGTVRKGDRLVSAGDGVARAAGPGEATAFNVIGRSLENKTTMDIGTIEAIVTIK